MRNFFGFMDETGVLANDPTQPYFALGLLRLNDTSKLLQKITTIKARHKGIINSINKDNNFNIQELKFNSLSQGKYIQMYKDIVKACLDYEHFYFSTILIERSKVRQSNKSTWRLQLDFAKHHIRSNCKNDNSIAIIADYLNKPKNDPFFEDEMRKLKNVYNACMLESNTSIFIQIVDIFVGAIIYRYKHPKNTNKRLNKTPKMQLVQFIEQKLEQNFIAHNMDSSGNYKKDKTLKGTFTIFGNDFYFSVYEKK